MPENMNMSLQEWAVNDMTRQIEFLTKEARFFGFSNPEELLRKDAELFDKIAATWRELNPAPRMN